MAHAIMFVSTYIQKESIDMSKNQRRMSKEDRKEQIIQSAMKLFVKNGYNATTTASIAEEAEISEVTLFRYFSSKEELFIAGLEPIIMISLEKSINESESLEAIEKLKYLIKDRVQFASKNHEVLKLILMESQINPELVSDNYINKIISIMEESIEQTGIKLNNKDLSSRLLMGSLLSFLYFPETDSDKIDDYVNNLVEMLMNQKEKETDE